MRQELPFLYGFGLISLVVVYAIGPTVILHSLNTTLARVETAAVFFVPSITVNDLHGLYNGTQRQLAYADKAVPAVSARPADAKIRILIVPGHEPGFGGTDFRGLFERDVVVDVANDLATLLRTNSHYEVFVARSKTAWDPMLSAYFDAHADEISAFRDAQTREMDALVGQGKITIETDQVSHRPAPTAAALHLYGINKWASDNNIDITIHLHVNDYAGRRASTPGVYSGFVVYVPDHQYSNASASRPLGEAIAARLGSYHPVSNLPQESAGVVDDQELIAVGSNNSADAASVLIELGYMYEPQFTNDTVRPLALSDYAYETYLGLQDFFKDSVGSKYGSTVFPYNWSTVDVQKGSTGAGVYALQSALHYLHFYPPQGKSLSDCPITGSIGDCTLSALAAFQSTNGVTVTNTLDAQTRTALTAALQ